MYKIAVVGTGYVGLVTGACLSDFGMDVTCVDNNEEKIKSLNNNVIPIYETGLDIIVERNVFYKRLKFTTDIKTAVEDNDVIFIAVPTPQDETGNADMKYVIEVVKDISKYMNDYKVIVDKSTVPIGTGRMVRELIKEELSKRNASFEFDVVSNPEFLREGTAVYDFTHPDRVVIGSESDKSKEIMKGVYRVLYLNETPIIETNIETAEMIKYASNAYLAMKITFINETANLCEKIGANVNDVAKAIGKDGRIGSKFLHPGPGYGGSCFPKDTNAFAQIGRKYGSPVTLVETTISANEHQKLLMFDKIKNEFGDLNGKTLAILGLSFKQNTDDMRDSPSITILNELYKEGARFKVYDPVAMKEAKKVFSNISDAITYCDDEYATMSGSDAVVIVTEWNQFRNLDLEKVMKNLKSPLFFDLRNIYRREMLENKGFKYIGVGQ